VSFARNQCSSCRAVSACDVNTVCFRDGTSPDAPFVAASVTQSAARAVVLIRLLLVNCLLLPQRLQHAGARDGG